MSPLIVTKVDRSNAAQAFDFVRALVSKANLAKEPWTLSWTPAILETELAVADVYIASTDGLFCGFLFLRPPGDGWEISLVAVDPNYRGQGVFGRFIDGISAQLAKSGDRPLFRLEVRVDNTAALSAYQSSGFRQIGLRKAYYRDGVDAAVLERS